MFTARPRLFAAALVLVFGLAASAQEKKAPATIKILIPETPVKTALKVEGKDLEANDKASREGVRVLVTPELEPGKTYAYKIEATIEPNNYTKIVRTREITFKAGETVELDIRKKDDKIKDNVVIRWVPTPRVVAKDMCELAKIGKDDVVMDPGCGDAIMLITAVEDAKAKRAIGTDIDPKMVKTAQDAVKAAKLDDKITIKEHLKPGSRIVSHRFIMGDWKPDKSITVDRVGDYGEEKFNLHVWTITGKEKTGDYPKVDPSTLNDS
jgi:uncharacterized protein (TIGR03000 family)